MSKGGRNIYSRPRTRLYNANYEIGESYYKSALDGIDRKYNRTSSTPPRFPSVPADFSEKTSSLSIDDDLNSSRRRVEKLISEPNLFDTRGGYLAARNGLDDDIDEEAASVLSRIRSKELNTLKSVRIPSNDDIDLDSTLNNIKSSRLIKRSEKILDSIGINENSRKLLNEEVSIKRQMKENGVNVESNLTKWTPLTLENGNRNGETSAVLRARETKNRLIDLEDEMADIAERRAAREKRVARYKAIVAENCEEKSDVADVASVNYTSRKEKKSVRF